MELTQKCSVCKRILSYDSFGKDSRRKNGKRLQCLECRREENALYRLTMSKEAKEKKRENSRKRKEIRNEAYRGRVRTDPKFRDEIREKALKQRYGLSVEEYEEISLYQGDKCAICDRPRKATLTVTGYRLNMGVDHDHNTGKIRGLLCPVCNSALGFIESNRYRKALEYLKNPPFNRMLEGKNNEKA